MSGNCLRQSDLQEVSKSWPTVTGSSTKGEEKKKPPCWMEESARSALDAFKNLPAGVYGRSAHVRFSRCWPHRQISSRHALENMPTVADLSLAAYI